jgi:hypothetical protein
MTTLEFDHGVVLPTGISAIIRKTSAEKNFATKPMRAHLMKNAQSLDDPVVKIHQLRLA